MFQDILHRGYMPILEDLFPNGPQDLLEANRILLSAIRSGDPAVIDEAMQLHAKAEEFPPSERFSQESGIQG